MARKTEQYVPKGIPKSITVEVGLTMEVRKDWYKLTFSQTNELPEKCDVEQERKALWNICKNELNNQAEKLCESLGVPFSN